MTLTVTPEAFRLAQVFTISRGSRTEARVLTVRVNRDGATGMGECVPYARYGESLESVTAQIEALPQDVTRAQLQQIMAPGAGRNAVDAALWDWEAKSSGRRAWQIAGLAEPRKNDPLRRAARQTILNGGYDLHAHCLPRVADFVEAVGQGRWKPSDR